MSIGRDNAAWVRLAGTASSPNWQVDIAGTPGAAVADWRHTGLLVTTLAPGEQRVLDLGAREAIVVPLSGGVHVRADLEGPGGTSCHEATLAGRECVWAGPSDTAYVPTGSRLTLTGAERDAGTEKGSDTSQVAVCLAVDVTGAPPAPFRHLAAAEVPVELRGAGMASRQVRNFGVPGVLEARRIIACEVLTPAGNWSSWPPHKHDTHVPGSESELEEIYYFQARSTGPAGSDPFGYQRVYAGGERPIDVLAEVRCDDVVLVPHGWHGPAIAAPHADLYYLNVMAGPGPDRAWLICDDPAHAWVRDAWADQLPDPRLT